MPVPKRKVSRSRRDKRSANKGLKPKAFSACQNCSEPIAPHQVCAACGYYKGRKIMRTKADRAQARGEKRQAKAAQVQAQQAEAAPAVAEPPAEK